MTAQDGTLLSTELVGRSRLFLLLIIIILDMQNCIREI